MAERGASRFRVSKEKREKKKKERRRKAKEADTFAHRAFKKVFK
jgi:hypothetical protein